MEKSILITGCSSGIGLRAAEILQQRGYRVFATARKMADIDRLKAQGLEGLQLDINDSISIKNALTQVLERTQGHLFALFNNCGYVQPGAIEDLSRESIRAQFETNVFGPIELTRLVVPIMRKQGYGRIIQNSSILGIITMPYIGAYSASKFALDGFTHTLRQELRHTPIHVSIIAPGPIISKLREKAKKHFDVNVNRPENPHHKAYQKITKRYSEAPPERETRIALPPDAVVKNLIHALESKKPKTHYYTGSGAKIFAFLRRLLSEKMLDWTITRFT